MKKLILLFIASIPLWGFAQKHKSCCVPPTSTEIFAQLSADESFAIAHKAPLPYTFEGKTGKMVSLPVLNGKAANAYEVKSKQPSSKWLLVFHEWWGLNDYIKKETERFADELPGVNVLALDLYDGYVASNREEAQEAMGKMNDVRSMEIIKAAIKYAGPAAKIGTIGWCMGGGWSMQASIQAGKQGIACVIYYGMPEFDRAKLNNLNADVLGIFATKDEWINNDIVEKFTGIMNELNKRLEVKKFEALHAFANPSNPDYMEQAAGEANTMAMDFLQARFK